MFTQDIFVTFKRAGFQLVRKSQGMFVFIKKVPLDVTAAEEIKSNKESTLEEDYSLKNIFI